MYCKIKYIHDMLVIFIPFEALVLVNSQLEILPSTPLGSKYF